MQFLYTCIWYSKCRDIWPFWMTSLGPRKVIKSLDENMTNFMVCFMSCNIYRNDKLLDICRQNDRWLVPCIYGTGTWRVECLCGQLSWSRSWTQRWDIIQFPHHTSKSWWHRHRHFLRGKPPMTGGFPPQRANNADLWSDLSLDARC